MTKLEQLRDIAKRLEAATGPDRELAVEIWLLLTPGATRKKLSYAHKASGRTCEIDKTRIDNGGRLITVEAITANIDVALALVERVLPGWGVNIQTVNPITFQGAFVQLVRVRDGYAHACAAPTAPLAILRALFAALIQQEESK